VNIYRAKRVLGSVHSRVSATTAKLKAEQHNKVDDDATSVLEYFDAASAVLQASWSWPYGKGQVEVFGPKGSLLADRDNLLFRSATQKPATGSYGESLRLTSLPSEASNPVSYFVHCVRDNKPIDDPLTARLMYRSWKFWMQREKRRAPDARRIYAEASAAENVATKSKKALDCVPAVGYLVRARIGRSRVRVRRRSMAPEFGLLQAQQLVLAQEKKSKHIRSG
jgi:predicted dehydrogenase